MNTKCELQTVLATDSVSQIITYGIRGDRVYIGLC